MPDDMGPGRAHSTDTPVSETANGAASNSGADEDRIGDAVGGARPDATAAGGTTIAEIEEVLTGIKYPAARRDLVQYAQFGQAPARVIQTLQRLPDRTYRSVRDLKQELQPSR